MRSICTLYVDAKLHNLFIGTENIETETFKEEQLKADVPVPNAAECARAFQGMVNFYNALNLREHSEPSTKAARY